MGLNAQTTVPTFSANQVLTADQQNQSARTGVPVFATTVERDAAFGGSGEKTLAEGQLCYLESTNVVQYYDGAAWATVGPATSGALTLITAVSFTAQTTVSMATGTFSSTYKNYMVVLNVPTTSASQDLKMRVNVAGSPQTGSGYYSALIASVPGGTSSVTAASNATSWTLMHVPGTNDAATIMVYDPLNTGESTSFNAQCSGANSVGSNAWLAGGGYWGTAQANDGLTFFVAGTITGTYRVYGLADS